MTDTLPRDVPNGKPTRVQVNLTLTVQGFKNIKGREPLYFPRCSSSLTHEIDSRFSDPQKCQAFPHDNQKDSEL